MKTNVNQIGEFVDAGSDNLLNHVFVSEKLNVNSSKMQRAVAVNSIDNEDGEQKVYYRMNQTGNIFYSTTSTVLEQNTKDLFDSVTVLFAAMTKALNKKGKDLFDYDAWGNIIKGSGYFIEVSKFEKELTIKNSSLTIDTQIIQGLIPGLKSGNSMEIAKSVLSAISGTYSTGGSHENSKFGHLLFICEELFGAPSITVRLFFGTKESHSTVTSSPCHKTTSQTLTQKQQADTFLFVSPDVIAKFASKYAEQPDEYTNLIDRLSDLVK